jgi:uncharacterized protein YjbI with pentapeptide repeats
MREIYKRPRRLSGSLAGFRRVAAVVWFLKIFLHHCCAEGTDVSLKPLVKPDQYNVNLCEDYFNKLKPGLATGTSYDPQEQYTINRLCEARSADLSRFVDELAQGAAAHGAPPADSKLLKTLRAEFVKAVVESNEFDSPGYDRISITGAIIEGDLNLAKIQINNALVLKDAQFLGNVNFSYSSTDHNLDISGTLPDSKTLCFKGLQTKASVFISDVVFQPDNRPGQKFFCTDNTDPPSIGLQGARIGGELSIRDTTARWIDAQGATITGQVLIQKSKLLRDVDFSAATAGGFALFDVKSPADLTKCDKATVFLEGIDIQGSADFVRSDLCGISMTGAHVSKNVNLLGSALAFFDFSGSNADGDLQIGPSLGPPRLPVWLPAFGDQPNLILSHSSVALVRVALNNWPNMCEVGLRRENKTGTCLPTSALKIDFCTSQQRVKPSPLPESDDYFISMKTIAEWTGVPDLHSWLYHHDYFIRTIVERMGSAGTISWLNQLNSNKEKDSPRTIVADFKFKAFGKPFFCAWDVNKSSIRNYMQSDYIFNDLSVNKSALKQWLKSTQYSPAEYQLIYDLLVTNGQSSDAKEIGYAGKMIETKQTFHHSWFAFISMIFSRWFIGYGYYPYLAIPWAVFFCALGASVFSRATVQEIRVSEGRVKSEPTLGWLKYVWGPTRFRLKKYTKGLPDTVENEQDYGVINPLAYSFDALLPIIRLRELHYQIEIGGWRHYYFYFQRIVGWVLGVFVLGALSGLAK